MTTYILLRKNKESGPLDLEQLKALGLLPDDRIWVEGQSVYWLSPGEIAELKPLLAGKLEKPPAAYAAEPGPGKTITGTISSGAQNGKEKNDIPAEEAIVKDIFPEEKKSPPKKNDSSASEQEQWKNYLPREKPGALAATQPIYLDEEITDKYFIPPVNPRKAAVKRPAPPRIKKIIFYTVFLAMGLIAGLLLKNSGNKKKGLSRQSLPSSLPNEIKSSDSTILNLQSPAATNGTDSMTRPDAEIANTALVKEDAGKEKHPAGILPEKEKTTVTTDSVVSTPIQNIKKEGKEKVENDQKGSTHPAEDISSQVDVKTNDYEVGSFGGIRNLELTLKNNSNYMLDKVTVELQYLKPRDEFLRSEHIIFSGVPPGGSQKIPVKKSTRGVKVVCRIINIESKENG